MASLFSKFQKLASDDALEHALFRPEVAITIALTIILTALPATRSPFGLPGWTWPLLGVIAVAVLIYTSLTDEDEKANARIQRFQQQFNPNAIKDPDLRDDVKTALEYQRRIEEQIQGMNKTLVRERMEDTAGRIDNWIQNVYQLAQRVDTYRRDDILERELRVLPQEIEQLEAQRRLEGNSAVLTQLEQVLDSKEKHYESLHDLDTKMRQARLQMEQSITSLATIYSQVQLVDAQDVNSSRAERLQGDIQEQVNRLNDLVDSINEVYTGDRF